MIEDTKYTVYKHTAPNGKVYIGITKQKPEKRWNNGNGYKDNEHFYRAIRSYKWENFKHKIIADGLAKEQACNMEIELIAKYDATNPKHGYNNTMGGETNIPSKETRRKLSESHKGANHPMYGKHLSTETRRKLSELNKGVNNPNYGKHPSAETWKKLSEANKGVNNSMYGKHHSSEARQKMSEARKGKSSFWKGKHLSAEACQKISEAHKGKHLSAEHRKKISESMKRYYLNNPELQRKLSESEKGVNNPMYGKHHSAEARRKMSEARKGTHLSDETRKKISESCKGKNAKAVICVETGTLYSSVTEASESIGVTRDAVGMAVRGKRKTAGGYHWKYAEA